MDREVEIVLTHKEFQKSLYLDQVIDRQAVYELKGATTLTDAHRSQLLTYLYLFNLERGKLVNFATPKVQSVFVNAAIPDVERHNFSVDRSNYVGPEFFLQMIIELVRDWGTSLSISLYHEAVTYQLGGCLVVEVLVPMNRDGIELGNQRFHLVSPVEAYQLTAFSRPDSGFPSHLERLLSLSPLTQLHWVNISHHQLQFVTISSRVCRKQFSQSSTESERHEA